MHHPEHSPDAAAPNPSQSATDTAAAAEPAALGSASVAEVEAQLQQALAMADEHHDQFVRARAELENVRRRAQEDVAKAHKYAIESFAEALVPVADSLRQALGTGNATAEQMREGIELTLRQLEAAFDKGALKAIDPVGQKFDPHRHQAIAAVPAPAGLAPNHVVSVLQVGWMIADRVLRPALVTVSQVS